MLTSHRGLKEQVRKTAPHRSLDFTPLKFCLWNYVKEVVYSDKINYVYRLI